MSTATATVNSSNDHQYVFWRGENGDVYEAYYTGSWHGPTDMHSKYGWGGNIASAPSVAVASDGTEYVFWRGTQGDIYEAYYNGSWYRWDMTSLYGW